MTLRRIIHALSVCGPTSSGKSDAALAAAEAAGGEIVNADSRQIYAQMRIGTGWPAPDSMARVPHHLYGIIPPSERYNAKRFVADARAVIAAIAARGRLPILVGGTGLYIEALAGTMPMDRPAASDGLRLRVLHEANMHEHETLREWLRALDPAAAARVPPGDRYRTLRAIEAALAGREAISASPISAAASDDSPSAFDLRLRIVTLHVPRAQLRRRIAERVAAMFAAGLEEEAVAVRVRWPAAPALSGIGYAEALAVRDGTATRAEALARVTLRTAQYAARQETWFRRLPSAHAIDAADAGRANAEVAAAARETVRAT